MNLKNINNIKKLKAFKPKQSLLTFSGNYITKKGYEFYCKCGNTYYSIRVQMILDEEVKSCGCLRHRSTYNSPNWKGYKELSGAYVSKLRICAEERNIKFSITAKDMYNQFEKQNGLCYFTGLPIEIPSSRKTSELKGSLDRLDSKLGYTKSNIVWVRQIINELKWDLTPDELFYWCKLIVDYNQL